MRAFEGPNDVEFAISELFSLTKITVIVNEVSHVQDDVPTSPLKTN